MERKDILLEKSYGKDGTHIFCKAQLLCAIDKARRLFQPFEYTCAGYLKRDMVRSYAKKLMLTREHVQQS